MADDVVIGPGALVRDNYGRLGIVLWECSTPKADWLSIQKDARMRDVGACRWWTIAPAIGGGAQAPEPLIELVRMATVDDALAIATEHKGSFFTLVRVFPALRERMPEPTW